MRSLWDVKSFNYRKKIGTSIALWDRNVKVKAQSAEVTRKLRATQKFNHDFVEMKKTEPAHNTWIRDDRKKHKPLDTVIFKKYSKNDISSSEVI